MQLGSSSSFTSMTKQPFSFTMEHDLCLYLAILSHFLVADGQENGELNRQATDSVPSGTPSSTETDGAKQAFVGLDVEHAKQAKSSVLEVLKKVRRGIGWLFFCQYFHNNGSSV